MIYYYYLNIDHANPLSVFDVVLVAFDRSSLQKSVYLGNVGLQ